MYSFPEFFDCCPFVREYLIGLEFLGERSGRPCLTGKWKRFPGFGQLVGEWVKGKPSVIYKTYMGKKRIKMFFSLKK